MPELWKQRLVQWRREPVTLRIERPTRLDKARSLGYKSLQGFVLVRQKVSRGGRMRPKIRKARRPKARRHKKIVAMNYQRIAEERANKNYVNLEVLNSYWVAEDGNNIWYEIIMVDPVKLSELSTRDGVNLQRLFSALSGKEIYVENFTGGTVIAGRRDYVLPTFEKAVHEDQLTEFYKTVYLNPYSGSSLTWNDAFNWL